MIYLYNDTGKEAWEVTTKNERFWRVQVIPGEGEERTFGIDIIKNDMTYDDFFVDILTEEVAEQSNRSAVWALGVHSFILCYSSKSGLPFLSPVSNDPNDQYHFDLYVLAYKVPDNMKLVYERSGKFTVLYSKLDEKKGIQYIIGVAKPSNIPFYYLTWATEDREQIHTKHMVVVKKTNEVGIFGHNYTKEEADKSPFKNIIFGKRDVTSVQPSKVNVPYFVILYPGDKPQIHDEFCVSRYGRKDKYTTYIDTLDKAVRNKIRIMTSKGYSAATIYIDKPFETVTEEDMRTCQYANMFKRVNFLCSDGRIKSL